MLRSAREHAHGTVVHPRARPRAASPPSISEAVAMIQLGRQLRYQSNDIVCDRMCADAVSLSRCRRLPLDVGNSSLRIVRSLCVSDLWLGR